MIYTCVNRKGNVVSKQKSFDFQPIPACNRNAKFIRVPSDDGTEKTTNTAPQLFLFAN